MSFLTNPSASSYIWLVLWVFSLTTGLYLGVIRSMIDRIRAGISTPPGEDTRPGKLLDSILCEPNHARPLHVEAALFSALQLFFGFLYLMSLWKEDPLSVMVFSSFILAFLGERLFSGAIPKVLASTNQYHLHLALGYPFVLFSRLFTWPFSFVLLRIENLFSFSGETGIRMALKKMRLPITFVPCPAKAQTSTLTSLRLLVTPWKWGN